MARSVTMTVTGPQAEVLMRLGWVDEAGRVEVPDAAG